MCAPRRPRCTAPSRWTDSIAVMEWVLSHRDGSSRLAQPGARSVLSKAEKAAAATPAVGARRCCSTRLPRPACARGEALGVAQARRERLRSHLGCRRGPRGEQKLEALAKQLEEEALAEVRSSPPCGESAELCAAKGSRRAGDDVSGSADVILAGRRRRCRRGGQRQRGTETRRHGGARDARGGAAREMGGNAGEDLVRQLKRWAARTKSPR